MCLAEWHSDASLYQGDNEQLRSSRASNKRPRPFIEEAIVSGKVSRTNSKGMCQMQCRTEGKGGSGFQTPTSEIPKALQNRVKLNPI